MIDGPRGAGKDETQHHKITRREFLHNTSLVAFDLLTTKYRAPRSAERSTEESRAQPNIIFIMADDLGYGDLGSYGQQLVQTPNLDRLAAEGIRFTQCYAASAVCAPSRWCLMTGLHTGHAHTAANEALLHPEDVTVAELLGTAGYSTAAIGKWAMGNPGTTGQPNQQGFEHWFGYLSQGYAHNYYPAFLWRNYTMAWIRANWECQRQAYSHDLFTEDALNYVWNHSGSPFFLYLPYTIPHANNELAAITGSGMQVPSDEPYTNEDWPQAEKNFAAMVTRLDADIGRLLQVLQDRGIDEKTVIFFTSDNGPHSDGGHDVTFFNSAGPLRGRKGSLYEGGIRVPMLVRWPGTITPGTVSEHVCASWDFLATAADIAGIEAPIYTNGVSILPTLLDDGQQKHNYLYWAFLHEDELTQAIRMGNWKGVRHNLTSEVELYDLYEDVGERNNLADQHPDIVQGVLEIMEFFRDGSHPVYMPFVTG